MLSTTLSVSSKRDQNIIELLSVIFAPCTRTDMLNCIRKCGIRASQSSAFSAPKLKPVCSL